ncbi:hypothetical protein ElyMa_001435100 [Elysia marginata]|uniref:Uncharacterized protein n=1 Tax=Elysia marginata TaxID=1093978 RepID=A0AAV4IWN1_9GAST|nr:hypothetical protein ElyMa_001435100 [Elysia marginata]
MGSPTGQCQPNHLLNSQRSSKFFHCPESGIPLTLECGKVMCLNSPSQGLNVDLPKAELEPQTSRFESRASTTRPRRHTEWRKRTPTTTTRKTR